MKLRDVSLTDRFDLTKAQVLLSGVQALARLPMMRNSLMPMRSPSIQA